MGVPSNSESRGVLDPAESTSDSAIWRDFAEAASPEAFYRGWLAIQCRMIPGVGIGVIFAAPSPGARFAPTASWPEGRRTPAHLGEAAEQALTERRGIVLKREAGDDSATPGRDRYDVAYPIQADGNLYGVVALDIAPRPERDLEAVLRQLQWGAGWLELLAHRLGTTRLEPASAEAARQRLQTVLDLLTSGPRRPAVLWRRVGLRHRAGDPAGLRAGQHRLRQRRSRPRARGLAQRALRQADQPRPRDRHGHG